MDWHDYDEHGRPVLFYDRVKFGAGRGVGYTAVTEPCVYCGRKHRHGTDKDGDGDGSRVPHCGPHTHDLTPTGRHRAYWAKGVIMCHVDHPDYVLRRRPSTA